MREVTNEVTKLIGNLKAKNMNREPEMKLREPNHRLMLRWIVVRQMKEREPTSSNQKQRKKKNNPNT